MDEQEVWKLWEREFADAKAFFTSKGNINTRSRLKDKWYKSFERMIAKLDEPTSEAKGL